MAASIRDVARAAGVSVGTVSRAFNGYSDIREETKENILVVAKQLGYVPNLNAKNLSAKNRQNMAILLAGFMADNGLSDELVVQLLRGASRYGIQNNIEFAVYVISSEQQKEKTYEQFCSEHSLSGAICFGLKTSDTYYACLQASKTPCVTVDVLVQGENIGYVGLDEFAAYRDLVRRTLACGHRRIVFLNGREEATVCAERLSGVNTELSQHGLTLEDTMYTDFCAERAEELVYQYITEHGTEGATAFVCASDFIALGAAKGISRCGYSVGREFSVTGFDGLRFARHIDPGFITVDQNMEGKGFAAAQMLHAIVDGRTTTRHCLVPYSLVEGDSLQPPVHRACV